MWEFIKNLPKFMELLKEGKEVADPVTWKSRTVATNAIITLLGTAFGIAKAFGYDFNLDSDIVQDLAVGVVALMAAGNSIMHVITDKRIGMSPDSGGSPPTGTAPVGGNTGAG